MKTPQQIVAELDNIFSQPNPPTTLYFVDDNFIGNRKAAKDEQSCRQTSEFAWNSQQPPAYRYQSEQEHGDNRQEPARYQGETKRKKIDNQHERPNYN